MFSDDVPKVNEHEASAKGNTTSTLVAVEPDQHVHCDTTSAHNVQEDGNVVESKASGNKSDIKAPETQDEDTMRPHASPSATLDVPLASVPIPTLESQPKDTSSNETESHGNGFTHVRSLEDRLKQLEERMRKMEQIKEPEPQTEAITQEHSSKEPEAEAQETVEPQRLHAIADIRYVNWADFKNRFSVDEGRYAVEVLMVGSNLKEEIRQERMMRKSKWKIHDTLKTKDAPAGKAQASSQANEQWAHRIRINSLPILSLLAKARGESWADEIHTFFRPFFLLKSFHSNLKEKLQELESKWGQTEVEKPSDEVDNKDVRLPDETCLDPTAKGRSPSEGKSDVNESKPADVAPSSMRDPESSAQGQPIAPNDTNDEKSLTDSIEALRDLRCYVQFMDDIIIPQEKQFDGTSCRKVRYDDLAYLFTLGGDDVYAPVAGEISASGSSKRPLVSRYQTLWRPYAINPPEFQNSDWENDSDSGSSDDEEEAEEQLKEKEWEPTIYNHFAIWGYYIDFDGKSFGAVRHVHRIRSFEGERDITSLPCYPLRYLENHGDYRRNLQELGKKYQEYLSIRHLAYTGSTLICNPTGDRIDDKEGKRLRHPSHVDSDIIVDFEETFQTHPSWRCTFHVPTPGEVNIGLKEDNFSLRRWADRQRKELISAETEKIHTRDYNRLRNENLKKDPFLAGYKERDGQGPDKKRQILREDELVLLPRRLFAYILRERKFAQVDVVYTRSAAGQIDGFKNLRLPRGHKRMVQALVDIHFKKRNIENLEYGDKLDFDIVQGKGRGLIILLHGVPGVGKTSTAECVAETNKKPLFSITCGDLGFSPAEVESSLSEIFRLAHLWDCVLLLDEADVFLAQRTKQDLNRNALVSVFLRILEYYNGILFLTTNRVGSFDEAFKSRIHMSLYYPPLKRKQTIAIWEMNLDRAVKIDAQEVKVTNQPAMVIHRAQLIEYAGRHFDDTDQGSGRWNGRQIRNAFQIATALAHFTAEEENKKRAETYQNQQPDHPLPMAAPILTVELFETVADATLHFDKYLTETAGFTDTQLAFEQGDRADHHYFHWARRTGARNLEKPGFEHDSLGAKNYDYSQYGTQARNTGSDHYHGEEDQAYAYPHENIVDRRSAHSSRNFPPQENYYSDGLNQGKAQNPRISGPATGRYSDNQYNSSSQKRPTPRAEKSAQFQYETPTRGKTAGISNPQGNSAGQHSRAYTTGQGSESSDED